MSLTDTSAAAFIATWGIEGYRENWEVYGKMSGVAEAELVSVCLAPFYNPHADALEVGCGGGYWTDHYLCPNFRTVTALDVLVRPSFALPVRYIEVPDRNFDCYGVADDSIDFAWSFGLFCHLTLPAVERYLRGIFRVLRPGGHACLYFSNADRRPGVASIANTEDGLLWVRNTLPETFAMLERSGFVDLVDRMPRLPDSMVSCRKP